jgi:hypothetical protein
LPVVPHAFSFFGSAALLLRADAHAPYQTDTEWEMSLDEALRYIEKIGAVAGCEIEGSRPLPRPCSISFFGGEPLARPDDLERLLDTALEFRLAGEVWATPAWVESYDQAFELLQRLHPKIHGLYVHTNAKLIERCGMDLMENLLNAAHAAAVPVQIRCGVGPGFPLPRALLALEQISSDSSFVHVTYIYLDSAPSQQNGRDRDGHELGFYLPEPSRLRCAEKFGFMVMPGGDVYPCLAGLGLEQLRLGNLAEQTAEEVIVSAIMRPGLCRLRATGPRHLFDRIAASPAVKSLRSGYLDPCDFHRHALQSPELARVLQESETLDPTAPLDGVTA